MSVPRNLQGLRASTRLTTPTSNDGDGEPTAPGDNAASKLLKGIDPAALAALFTQKNEALIRKALKLAEEVIYNGIRSKFILATKAEHYKDHESIYYAPYTGFLSSFLETSVMFNTTRNPQYHSLTHITTVLCPQLVLYKGGNSLVELVREVFTSDPSTWAEPVIPTNDDSRPQAAPAAGSASTAAAPGPEIISDATSGSEPSALIAARMLGKEHAPDIVKFISWRVPDAALVVCETATGDTSAPFWKANIELSVLYNWQPVLIVENKGWTGRQTALTAMNVIKTTLEDQVIQQMTHAFARFPKSDRRLGCIVTCSGYWRYEECIAVTVRDVKTKKLKVEAEYVPIAPANAKPIKEFPPTWQEKQAAGKKTKKSRKPLGPRPESESDSGSEPESRPLASQVAIDLENIFQRGKFMEDKQTQTEGSMEMPMINLADLPRSVAVINLIMQRIQECHSDYWTDGTGTFHKGLRLLEHIASVEPSFDYKFGMFVPGLHA